MDQPYSIMSTNSNLPPNRFRFVFENKGFFRLFRSILLLSLLLLLQRISATLLPDRNDPTDRHNQLFHDQSHVLHRRSLVDNNNNNNNNHNDDDLSIFSSNDQNDMQPSSNHSFDISYKENSIQEDELVSSDTNYYQEQDQEQEPIIHKYLDKALAQRACKLDRGSQRSDELNNTFLTYCTRYNLENLFSNEILMSIMHEDSGVCRKVLDEFIQLDELINQFDSLFKNLLRRYNCHNGYSVKWNCEDCKKAYKDWLCAVNLPYYMNGERIKPCISFCERVEQRCPYLHPITREQYGGQPVFICREITPDIPYEDPTKCYDLCHIRHNSTELISDSLSKYEPSYCPRTSTLAENVRNDPHYVERINVQQHIPLDGSPGFDSADTNRTLPEDSDGSNNWSDIYNPNDDSEDLPFSPARKPTTSPTKATSSSGSTHTKGTSDRIQEVHRKKLSDLREVLIVYKNQPRTHHFGQPSDHNSVNTTKSTSQSIWAKWTG